MYQEQQRLNVDVNNQFQSKIVSIRFIFEISSIEFLFKIKINPIILDKDRLLKLLMRKAVSLCVYLFLNQVKTAQIIGVKFITTIG